MIRELYNHRAYYERILSFLEDWESKVTFKPDRFYFKNNLGYLTGLPRLLFKFGLFEKERALFWKLIFKLLSQKLQCLTTVLAQIASGHHFRKSFQEAFLPS